MSVDLKTTRSSIYRPDSNAVMVSLLGLKFTKLHSTENLMIDSSIKLINI